MQRCRVFSHLFSNNISAPKRWICRERKGEKSKGKLPKPPSQKPSPRVSYKERKSENSFIYICVRYSERRIGCRGERERKREGQRKAVERAKTRLGKRVFREREPGRKRDFRKRREPGLRRGILVSEEGAQIEKKGFWREKEATQIEIQGLWREKEGC